MDNQDLRPEQIAALSHAIELNDEARIRRQGTQAAVLVMRDARGIVEAVGGGSFVGALKPPE
jgi:hypothetical protein